jgi:hypothetical protein
MPPCQNFGFFQLRMSAPFRKISKFQGKTALHYALESQSLNARNVFLEEKEIDVNTGLKDYTAMYRWSDEFNHPGTSSWIWFYYAGGSDFVFQRISSILQRRLEKVVSYARNLISSHLTKFYLGTHQQK